MIIDEFALCGQKHFYHLENNLKEALTEEDEDGKEFGGISIIMTGDYS